MDSAKVAVVRDWPCPHSVRALRGFLGIAGYYHRFDFTLEYKPGKRNVVADALSRYDEEAGKLNVVSALTFTLLQEVRAAQTSDPALVALREQITAGELKDPWSIRDGLVLFRERIYVSPSSTLHRLRRDFHTPNARRLVQEYVHACATCQRFKTEHLHPGGLVLPLPVPSTVLGKLFR